MLNCFTIINLGDGGWKLNYRNGKIELGDWQLKLVALGYDLKIEATVERLEFTGLLLKVADGGRWLVVTYDDFIICNIYLFRR